MRDLKTLNQSDDTQLFEKAKPSNELPLRQSMHNFI